MTSYNYSKLTCPDCGRTDTCPQMASTNGFGWRQWSDGWGRGDYWQTETGLLACWCGAVFTSGEANPEYDGRHRPSSSSTGCIGECRTDDAWRAVHLRRWRNEGTERLARLQCLWGIEESERMRSPSADVAVSTLPPPSLALSPESKENMERLIALLEPHNDYGLVAGDILRRLGRFDEAIATYKADETLPPRWSGLLCGLAANEHSELVELPVH